MINPEVAANAETVLLPLEREEIRKKFRRALLVDDEQQYAKSVKQNLELIGFETTVSSSIDAAAQELLSKTFPVIICDNVFGQLTNPRGSEFIRDHTNLLSGGRVVLMSGYPQKHIVDFDLLNTRGVKFIRKGAGAIEELKRFCEQAVEDHTEKFTEYLGNVCNTLIRGGEYEAPVEKTSTEQQLISRARIYLLNYMKQFPNQELTQFYIGGHPYSPSDVIREIEKNSELASILIDQLLDDLLESPND